MVFSLLYLGMYRVLGLIISSSRSESDKDIEIMVLRHQLRVLERQIHGRVRYRPADRAILAALSRCLPRAHWRCFLVSPTPSCVGTGSWPGASGDDGPSILQVQSGTFVTAYNFESAHGIKDFVIVSYFAIGPKGTLYADNLNGAFDPYQQIVQVANGQATSLWQGATGPR